MTSQSNPNNISYTADCAVSFYDQLEDVARSDWSIREKYLVLRDIFKRVVNQGIALSSINFIGMFAKLDYLIKQHNIPSDVAIIIHDTRKGLNGIHGTSDHDLDISLPYDIMGTALLVEHTEGGVPVPPALSALFPKKERKRAWSKFDVNLLRCIVVAWDDDYIYATEEQNLSKLKICYSPQNHYLSHNGKGDWSYLKQIMRKDAQLNLVRIRMEEDVCMPELIIYEPDYLIDITTIASCFETYAESPFVNAVNKLKPQANTLHIHLGNLAGRFLDDIVHDRKQSFNESVMEFFKTNAISLTSCDDMNDRQLVTRFYQDARTQRSNIQKLIGEDLPKAINEYDPKAVVLEPTFFSEVLGIQGRLDFLLDKSGNATIIEQKSGKGAFVPFSQQGMSALGDKSLHNANQPEPQEKHLVQLSLYRALFNYEFNKRSDQLRHFMLLYSKYSNGLVSIASLPELTLRAIRMRNLLTWCEMSYTEDGLGVLARLTPEMLNRKGSTGRLWNEWTRPELERLLEPIHKASPLELAYYLRFMKFIEKEHLLSKVGNKTKDDSGFAAIWLDTLEDKRAAGNIYENLSIASFGIRDGMVESLRLTFADDIGYGLPTDTSNFRKGDIVILYPYKEGQVPNACAQMVNRASIKDITPEGIEVVLRNSQTDKQVFDSPDGTFWAIEHDMFESSSRALYSGMHSFLSASKARRDLLLCQRQPAIDEHVHMRGDYGRFNTLVERAKQSRDLFLVIGPPGTGKTSFGLLNILKEELTDSHSNVILLSFTNRAVDEICSKLVESDIDFLRIGSELACEEAYHDHLLARRVEQCRTSREVRNIIDGTRVFCATTAALNSNIGIFKIKHFDLAVIDESSQILEPHLIGLLSAQSGGRDAIGRFVLIGDHKQLPAVVQQTPEESRVDEPELHAIGLTDCRMSLFERLLAGFKTPQGYDPRYVYMLTRQGRMHQSIAEFPNLAFYGNRLEVVPLSHQMLPCSPSCSTNGIAQLLSSRRLAFVASAKPRTSASVKTNLVEAEMIAATVVEVYRLTKDYFDTCQTVGVIVPYRNQIATIRSAIDRSGVGVLHDITIDTVERYQGSQRDYIIYGFTVQQPNQLNFLTNNVFEEDGMVIDRKLNVAMTRARLHLMMVGNPDILRENFTFYKLLEYTKAKGGYLDVPFERYCSGDFSLDELEVAMPDCHALTSEHHAPTPSADPDDVLFGNNRDANLVFINYGRHDFSHGMMVYSKIEQRAVMLSAELQVEIYCHYLMPQYIAEAKAFYLSHMPSLLPLALKHEGRIRMVDFGCGPATCALALSDILLSAETTTSAGDNRMTGEDVRTIGWSDAENGVSRCQLSLDYIGIDPSEHMLQKAAALLESVSPSNTTWHFSTSLTGRGGALAPDKDALAPDKDALAPDKGTLAPDKEALVPDKEALVLFNFSHVFECIDVAAAEELATKLNALSHADKRNDYLALVLQSDSDSRLRSYEVFKKTSDMQILSTPNV